MAKIRTTIPAIANPVVKVTRRFAASIVSISAKRRRGTPRAPNAASSSAVDAAAAARPTSRARKVRHHRPVGEADRRRRSLPATRYPNVVKRRLSSVACFSSFAAEETHGPGAASWPHGCGPGAGPLTRPGTPTPQTVDPRVCTGTILPWPIVAGLEVNLADDLLRCMGAFACRNGIEIGRPRRRAEPV